MKTFARLHTLALAGLIGFASVVAPTPAHAWLKFCNKTTKSVYVNLTRPDSSCQQCSGNVCAGGTSPWRRTGWWLMAPDACATVYGGSADNKTFYYEAHSTDWSMVWESSSNVWENVYAAHDYCASSALFDASKIFTSGHRQFTGTATNYTRNLIP